MQSFKELEEELSRDKILKPLDKLLTEMHRIGFEVSYSYDFVDVSIYGSIPDEIDVSALKGLSQLQVFSSGNNKILFCADNQLGKAFSSWCGENCTRSRASTADGNGYLEWNVNHTEEK